MTADKSAGHRKHLSDLHWQTCTMGRYRKNSPSRRPQPKSGPYSDDDAALWEQVTQTVTELPSRRDMVSLPDDVRAIDVAADGGR